MDFENHQFLQPNSQVIKLFCNFNQPFREWSPFWRSSKNKSFWFNPVSECAVPSTWKISSFLVNSCSSFKVSLIQPSLTPAYQPFSSLSSAPTSPSRPPIHRLPQFSVLHTHNCLPILSLMPQISPSIILITPLKTPLAPLSHLSQRYLLHKTPNFVESNHTLSQSVWIVYFEFMTLIHSLALNRHHWTYNVPQ